MVGMMAVGMVGLMRFEVCEGSIDVNGCGVHVAHAISESCLMLTLGKFGMDESISGQIMMLGGVNKDRSGKKYSQNSSNVGLCKTYVKLVLGVGVVGRIARSFTY